MGFFLRLNVIGKGNKTDITAENFAELRESKRCLSLVYSFFENYRIVVESYKKLELAKYECELDSILFWENGYEYFSNTIVLLSSPLAGYLFSARYFIDASDKIISQLLSNEQVLKFKTFRSSQYDSIPEYRFIEALRNYAQHREIPLHEVTYHNGTENHEDPLHYSLVCSLSIYSSKKNLLKDPSFKKTALDGLDDKVDIIKCIRFHMECLWEQQRFLQEEMKDTEEKSRNVAESAINIHSERTGHSSPGLYAVWEDDSGQLQEEVLVNLSWDDARRKAIKRARSLKNLKKRYITGKIQIDKPK